MKKILLFLISVFCSNGGVNANLCHEKDFWIEALNESNSLISSDKNINPCLMSGTKNIESGFDLLFTDKQKIQKSIVTLAEVLRANLAQVEVINMYAHNAENMEILLSALIHNRTIKRVYLKRLQPSSAELLSKVIAHNPIIEILECDNSRITDSGIRLIARALEKNQNLTVLGFLNSTFSMQSRKAIEEAWSKNQVSNRWQQIKF